MLDRESLTPVQREMIFSNLLLLCQKCDVILDERLPDFPRAKLDLSMIMHYLRKAQETLVVSV